MACVAEDTALVGSRLTTLSVEALPSRQKVKKGGIYFLLCTLPSFLHFFLARSTYNVSTINTFIFKRKTLGPTKFQCGIAHAGLCWTMWMQVYLASKCLRVMKAHDLSPRVGKVSPKRVGTTGRRTPRDTRMASKL